MPLAVPDPRQGKARFVGTVALTVEVAVDGLDALLGDTVEDGLECFGQARANAGGVASQRVGLGTAPDSFDDPQARQAELCERLLVGQQAAATGLAGDGAPGHGRGVQATAAIEPSEGPRVQPGVGGGDHHQRIALRISSTP